MLERQTQQLRQSIDTGGALLFHARIREEDMLKLCGVKGFATSIEVTEEPSEETSHAFRHIYFPAAQSSQVSDQIALSLCFRERTLNLFALRRSS
jgi:hypothetical protein